MRKPRSRSKQAFNVASAGASLLLAVSCVGAIDGGLGDLGNGGGARTMAPGALDAGPGGTSAALDDAGGASDDGGPATPPIGTADAGDAGAARGAGPGGGYPAGWLYTEGNTIMVSSGATGKRWMGRGVNVDDIFMCGYNSNLSQVNPDTQEETAFAGLIRDWKPNFVRFSLSMKSFATVSWLSNPAQYKTPATHVINALGKNPGVYVLVTLRSEASMIQGDPGNLEATGIPSDATTTPDAAKYPTGTDAVYEALVDTFAHASFVLFGLTNEAGGNARSDAIITPAMNHAVGTIRAEEDKLGVPHHIVSVQGSAYSSLLKAYTASPLPITHDNVVYELHYYPNAGPQTPSNYAMADTLPVIVGEYGGFTTAVPQSGFYADMEAKQIPNLAWDFDPFSGCAPDLVTVTHDATKITPTGWGTSVKAYLNAHAP